MSLRTLRLSFGFGFAVLALVAATGGACAATARASDPITIYDGPGYGYRPVGKLTRNEVVGLSECTPSGRWCHVVRNGPDGWVLASYLIGSAAKVEATPWKPLVDPFFHPYRRGHIFSH
jgi:uncharacterized protein YraI